MAEKILQTLQRRSEFLQHLKEDMEKNDKIHEDNFKILKSLEDTSDHIRELGKHPEQTALIPMCKNLYLPGTIVHTGEYYMKTTAVPDSYLTLHTLDQTLEALDKRIQVQQKVIEQAEFGKAQLEERMKILTGDFDFEEGMKDDTGVAKDMPEEIKSEMGVAIRVGNYYEILEFED